MDPQKFDALTRRLNGARAGSRRRVLTVLVGSAFGQVLGLPWVDEAAAKCKKGWKRCLGPGSSCLNLNTEPDHCGECGNKCPTEQPCCIKGKCRKMCGDTCCADCFVEIPLLGGPDLENPVCCKSSGGTICEHKKPGPGDDRCCYPNQVCVHGKCCCNDCEGVVTCGGKCCAKESCCNGKCCEKGYICATKNEGDPKTCVRANRDCVGTQDCFPGETCHGGTCCSGLRVCGDGNGIHVCCKADEYCEFQQEQQIAECCPINTICKGTYRGHRVRR